MIFGSNFGVSHNLFGADGRPIARVGIERLYAHIVSPFGRLEFRLSAYSIKGKHVQFFFVAIVLGVSVSKDIGPLPHLTN